MTPEPTRLTGTGIYRIVWLPGSDRLRGYCWCGTSQEAEDPVELWDWLLGHPEQHGNGPDPDRPVPPVGRLPAGMRA
ncbi:hypothetical protein [Micromonospora sp. NBC_01796]|uniref:hypothetical protein n=1 Tax=Micromonospora sp. NBC_01796 TaxID=2975987 RepID=UPI002DDBD700|nr:hypothetical protein [Micromonospora sp. NBC_01796]WSA85550.1 hypothetical protein OIE47_35245 [Micromonospora sp. NBC_01796]